MFIQNKNIDNIDETLKNISSIDNAKKKQERKKGRTNDQRYL